MSVKKWSPIIAVQGQDFFFFLGFISVLTICPIAPYDCEGLQIKMSHMSKRPGANKSTRRVIAAVGWLLTAPVSLVLQSHRTY